MAMSGDVVAHDLASPMSLWAARCLDTARVAAVFTAVTAPISTAAASLGSAVFLIALLLSGQAHRIASAGFRSTAGKAVLLFLAWVLASAAWSEAALSTALRDFWAWRKLVYLYLALPLFHDESWKRRALVALVYTGALEVMLSYVSFAGWLPYRFDTPGVMLTNYAVQGAAFTLTAACAVQLSLWAKGSHRWWYAVVALALVVNVLFFNFGRTGYLALAAVTLTWAVVAGGWRWSAAAIVLLAALFAAAYAWSPTFHQRIAQGWTELTDNHELTSVTQMGIRKLFVRNSVELIRQRPIVGHGLGSFKTVYGDYVDRHYSGVQATHAGDPHNQYLYIAFEHGIVGLALFILMIAALLRSFPHDAYGRIAACGLVAWCLTSFFSSHFRTFPEGHFYALLIAILGASPALRVRVSDHG
jgi:O-antigen ligase